MRSGEPAHVHWVERPGLLRAFEEEIRRGPDIVHLHGWGTAQLSRLAAGVPTLHVPMDAWALGIGNRALPGWRNALERSQVSKIARHEARHYPGCTAVVVVAEGDATHLRRIAPDARIEVVPNGVEPGPEPDDPTAVPVIGFHGSFENQANRDAAIYLAREVFPLIRRDVPDARLVLIGRDPTPEILRFAGDAIEVTGAVADVREALARVAVYVAPMVSGTGIKNKVLEAMAAALPVVATPRAIDGIGEGAGVRIAESAESLAREANALLGSAAARRAEGRGARERVIASFTWERSARAIERLWEEIQR
jgi:glycosyltransferase involved in cell wall biosynthesis